MVDIHSATVEIRRGKKRRRREEEGTTGQNIMSASATQGGIKKRQYLENDQDGTWLQQIRNFDP